MIITVNNKCYEIKKRNTKEVIKELHQLNLTATYYVISNRKEKVVRIVVKNPDEKLDKESHLKKAKEDGLSAKHVDMVYATKVEPGNIPEENPNINGKRRFGKLNRFKKDSYEKKSKFPKVATILILITFIAAALIVIPLLSSNGIKLFEDFVKYWPKMN